MRERPIIFSAPMVRAILAGSKTQTRRVIRKPERFTNIRECGFCCKIGQPGDRLWVRETWQADPIIDDTWASTAWSGCKDSRIADLPERFRHPRYVNFRADWLHGEIRWRPAIHMPHWASRITLKVTDVRVERLQAISESDAVAEGLSRSSDGFAWHVEDDRHRAADPRESYASLWETINGAGSWDANPWVWVVEFKRLP